MKRTLTGIAAAAVVLGTLAPAAFASTTTLTPAGGKTISLDGTTLYNGVQTGTAKDAGTITRYFPIYYLQQALTKGGYTNTYNPSTSTWDISMPGVDASSVTVDGGVGSGNAAISINGTVVKKFNAQWAKDLAGGPKAVVTTYFPLYYLSKVLVAAGFNNAWDGFNFGFKSYVAPVVNPAVSGVTAPNLAQVLVTFNKAVDKDSAETLANYSVNGHTPDAAALQADGKSVLLTVTSHPMANNSNNNDVAVTGVQDTTGATIADYDNSSVSASDTTAPTVTGISVTGPNTFNVTFSEPVTVVTPSTDFIVDGGNYYVTGATNASANVVTVTTGADLSAGSHTVVINQGVTDVKDYANLPVGQTSKTFTVNPVTAKPTVSISSASQTKVVLKFSQPVSGVDFAAIYALYNNASFGDVAFATPDPNGTISGAYNDTWDLSFSKPLPPGADALYITPDTTTGITDAWGNAADAATLSASIVNDTTAPTITKATLAPNTAKTSDTVTVVFNKDVTDKNGGDPGVANVILKDANGNTVGLSTPNWDASTDTLTLDAGALTGGTYTLTVQNIVDTTPNQNALASFTKQFSVVSITAPTATAEYVDSGKAILVTYSQPMSTTGSTSIGSAGNYQVVDFAGASDAVSSVQVVNNKSVILSLKNTLAAGKPVVSIQGVTDTDGNAFSAFGATAIGSAVTTPDNGAAPTEVDAISPTQIKVTFNNALTGFQASNFSLNDGQTPNSAPAIGSIASVTTDTDGNSVVVFNLASGSKLNANGTDAAGHNVYLNVTPGSEKDNLGQTIAAQTGAATPADEALDKILPALSSTTPVEVQTLDASGYAKTISVTYTENLDATSVASTTYSVAGYTVSGATVNNNVVTLNVTAGSSAAELPSVTQLTNVLDVAGNAVTGWTKATTDAVTDIAVGNSAIVTAVDNTAFTITMSHGTGSTGTSSYTASQLIGAVKALDNSAQTYAVVDSSDVAVASGTAIVSGDKVIVTSADGSWTQTYTVTVS